MKQLDSNKSNISVLVCITIARFEFRYHWLFPLVLARMPVLRLIIDNSAKEGVEPNSVPIWNPEDNLCGRLQLVSSSKDNPVLEKIAVYFEGESLASSFMT